MQRHQGHPDRKTEEKSQEEPLLRGQRNHQIAQSQQIEADRADRFAVVVGQIDDGD